MITRSLRMLAKSNTAVIACLALSLLAAAGLSAQDRDSDDIATIAATLDRFHEAAASGDWDAYFALMSDDAVFLGTDAGERWTKPEFQAYAGNRDGWTYVPRTRHINLTPDGNSAWFDELLDSENYGTSRGTGVLIRTPGGWRISQYHLTFPIPNPLAGEITDAIKAFETAQ